MIKEMIFLRLPAIIKTHKKIALGIVIGVTLLIGASSTYVGLKHFSHKSDSPAVIAARDYNAAVKKKAQLIATVKKQIALPTNEDPVLATVSNAKSLPQYDFFQEALNGDRILMYPKNKKVFLYRPSTQQVVAQAPLEYRVGMPDPAATASAAQSTLEEQGVPTPTTNVTPQTNVPLHEKVLINH